MSLERRAADVLRPAEPVGRYGPLGGLRQNSQNSVSGGSGGPEEGEDQAAGHFESEVSTLTAEEVAYLAEIQDSHQLAALERQLEDERELDANFRSRTVSGVGAAAASRGGPIAGFREGANDPASAAVSASRGSSGAFRPVDNATSQSLSKLTAARRSTVLPSVLAKHMQRNNRSSLLKDTKYGAAKVRVVAKPLVAPKMLATVSLQGRPSAAEVQERGDALAGNQLRISEQTHSRAAQPFLPRRRTAAVVTAQEGVALAECARNDEYKAATPVEPALLPKRVRRDEPTIDPAPTRMSLVDY